MPYNQMSNYGLGSGLRVPTVNNSLNYLNSGKSFGMTDYNIVPQGMTSGQGLKAPDMQSFSLSNFDGTNPPATGFNWDGFFLGDRNVTTGARGPSNALGLLNAGFAGMNAYGALQTGKAAMGTLAQRKEEFGKNWGAAVLGQQSAVNDTAAIHAAMRGGSAAEQAAYAESWAASRRMT